jgi:hypothetical protein
MASLEDSGKQFPEFTVFCQDAYCPGVSIGHLDMTTDQVRLIWQVNPDNCWEPGWLRYLLQAFNVEQIVDLSHEVVGGPAIIVTDGQEINGRSVEAYLQRFNNEGHNVGVIHISDEDCKSRWSFYHRAAFVYRNYLRADTSHLPHCRYFALGYRNGFTDALAVPHISDRSYRWSFAGQVKSSRSRMLRAARKIPGGKVFLTNGLQDPEALDVDSYAKLLADSVFVPCPRGNVSLDTFRVYEALEAGAIPIVEDGTVAPVVVHANGHPALRRFRDWFNSSGRPPSIDDETEGAHQSYWLEAYGSDFPCPRIHDWRNLVHVMSNINAEETSEHCIEWWQGYKNSLVSKLCRDVKQLLSIKY